MIRALSRSRLRAASTLAVLAAALLALVAAPALSARADTYFPISGSGSTWSQNALDQWRKNVATTYGMTVNYSGSGSSQGRRDFIQGTVDFAVSEIPFQANPEDGSAPEVPTTGYAYMPIVAGGTSFMYNLKIGGKLVTNLRLSGSTIAKIFTGVITNWNDAAIKADNPGLSMPDKQIVPVVRSDGSGSTAQFTLWMSKQQSSIWDAYCKKVGRSTPCGLTSQYPTSGSMKAQSGSLGVAGYVSQNYGEGSITYVEYSYALKSGFPVAKVLNNAGYYIEPTAPSVAVALLKAQINSDLTQNLDGVYNNSDPRTYPLSSYSYMIVPTQVAGIFTADKGKTLSTFGQYMICTGQQQAAALGYSPLPMNLVQAGYTQLKRIPGTVVGDFDASKCANPTFKAGDSLSSNALAASAAQPAACDKQGTTQCATGTGGAASTSTAVSAAASGAKSAASGANGTSGSGTTTSASGTTTGVDANGDGVIDSAASTSGGTGEAAASTPFTLASTIDGGQVGVMVAAGVLLVAALVLPAFFIGRRQR